VGPALYRGARWTSIKSKPWSPREDRWQKSLNFCSHRIEIADLSCKFARVIGPRIGAADRAHLAAGMEAGETNVFSIFRVVYAPESSAGLAVDGGHANGDRVAASADPQHQYRRRPPMRLAKPRKSREHRRSLRYPRASPQRRRRLRHLAGNAHAAHSWPRGRMVARRRRARAGDCVTAADSGKRDVAYGSPLCQTTDCVRLRPR
jgi:hypothetical protein